jgi:hypothetical protein
MEMRDSRLVVEADSKVSVESFNDGDRDLGDRHMVPIARGLVLVVSTEREEGVIPPAGPTGASNSGISPLASSGMGCCCRVDSSLSRRDP